MPQGNAHMIPPGLWWQEPTKTTVPKLLLKSAAKLGAMFAGFYLIQQMRALSYNYTYKNFVGKTMSLGPISVLTHEPWSAEEIDRLKASKSQQ